MTPAQRDAFLQETRIGKLATLNADGSPNVVPVWYEWDGTHARLFTGRDTPKIERIRRDPRVCLLAEEPVGALEAWVSIEGTAEIVEAGGYELAARLALRYYEGQRAARALEAWGRQREAWVVVQITPRRIRSSAPGA